MSPKTEQALLLLLLAAAALLLLVTIEGIGLCVDEPPYFRAGDAYVAALSRQVARLFSNGVGAALDRTLIDEGWGFNHEHPPLAKLVYGATGALERLGVGRIAAHRSGAVLLFLAGMWVLMRFLRQRWGIFAALFGGGALLTMPQVFAHAHMAALDLPYALFALFVTVAFLWGLEDVRGSIAAGVLFGGALAVKINALILPIPLFLWAIAFHPWRRWWRNALAIFLLGPLVFFLSWPWLWPEPLTRLSEYIAFHLHHPFHPTWYFGRVYSDPPAPWHYAPVMLAITTPPVTLLFGLLGIGVSGLRRDRVGILFLLQIVFAILPVALPSTPAYDGVRLFMAAPLFLAALSGIGFEAFLRVALQSRICRRLPAMIRGKERLPWVILGVSLLPALFEVIAVDPYQLSYFNLLIGGERGALAAGMESTFWGEANNRRVLTYLNEVLPPGAALDTNSETYTTFPEYQRVGWLRADITFRPNAPFWVLSCQQGYSGPWWWRLYRGEDPRYETMKTFTFRGVPLVKVFRRRDGQRR